MKALGTVPAQFKCYRSLRFVDIGVVIVIGGEGTCPVTQKVIGQDQAWALSKASCCPGGGSQAFLLYPVTETLLLI